MQEYQGNIGLYLSGQQIKIASCGIFITQPKIKDIVVQMGESDFISTANLLTHLDKFAAAIKEGNSVLDELSDFQILIEVLRQKNSSFYGMITNFFNLCLPQFHFKCSKHSIDFLTEDDTTVGMINVFNYDDFAVTLKELFIPRQKEEEPEYNIDESNELSRRLLEKIKRNRELLAKQRVAKEGENVSLFGLYISSLSIGLGMDINIFYNYTPFQLYDSFNRFMAKMQRDKYDSLLLVPFADTSKIKENEPPNWLENLYKPIEQKYNSLQGLSAVHSNAR